MSLGKMLPTLVCNMWYALTLIVSRKQLDMRVCEAQGLEWGMKVCEAWSMRWLNMISSVTSYLESHNATYVEFTTRILRANVKLVVWTS